MNDAGLTDETHQGEEFIRALLNSLPEHVVVLDRQGIVCAVNDSWERFALECGGEPSAVSTGVSYLDVCRRAAQSGDLDAINVVKQLEDLLSGRSTTCVVEYPCHSPERERWFLMQGRRVINGSGEVILSHLDITERKQNENDLAFLADLSEIFAPLVSQELITQIAAEKLGKYLNLTRVTISDAAVSLNEVIVLYDQRDSQLKKGYRTYRCRGFLNVALVDELKQGNAVVINDVVTDPRTKDFADQFRELNIGSKILAPCSQDGRLTFLLALHKAAPYMWQTREVKLVREVATRIYLRVDRARAEVSLRESEERFRVMADTLPLIVWVHDEVGNLSFVNQTFCDYFGVDRKDMRERKWRQLTHPDDIDAYDAEFMACVRERRRFHREVRARRADGEWRWQESWAQPRIDDHGRYLGHIGTSADITERKRAEQTLREQDRRKDEFLATLAHELRNPLAPIRMGLEVIKQSKNDPELLEDTRQTMERQTEQLVTLVNDLLDVSRITQGKFQLKKRRVAIKEVIQSALEACRSTINESHHDLMLTVPEEPIYLDADPNRLSQVLTNLLNNASRYTPDGGKIFLSAERMGDQLCIQVTDTGLGIPLELQHRVFDMFAQINQNDEQRRTGLGIGLSLVKSLVTMHGGHVAVSSEGPNRGSTFSVSLPVANNQAHASNQAGTSRTSKETPDIDTPRLKRRVLVVDDNFAAAKTLSIVVKMMGNEVFIANDGKEGCEMAAYLFPDIILMDIGMPKMDGYEAARWIRQQPWGADILLIALTGWGQEDDRQKTKEVGFDHHLVKPAEPQELERLLGAKRAH